MVRYQDIESQIEKPVTNYDKPSKEAVLLWERLFNAINHDGSLEEKHINILAAAPKIAAMSTRLQSHAMQFGYLFNLFHEDGYNFHKTNFVLERCDLKDLPREQRLEFARSIFKLRPEMIKPVLAELATIELSVALDALKDIEHIIKQTRQHINFLIPELESPKEKSNAFHISGEQPIPGKIYRFTNHGDSYKFAEHNEPGRAADRCEETDSSI